MCDDVVVSATPESEHGETASERMLRILRGVDLEPQQTSDDIEPKSTDESRDKQFEEDVPPHHGS